ncbi:hypothetical protein T07_4404 [Trichinella nelsoni]|uniref:Uncharacterized protein n=1 Tax=Trichinella nelsoni TaxID=6336 RepID=A0A0V0S1Y7_9BILA|nr:hypothetical protein T07_4404 [Trichinella nelsoni]
MRGVEQSSVPGSSLLPIPRDTVKKTVELSCVIFEKTALRTRRLAMASNDCS